MSASDPSRETAPLPTAAQTASASERATTASGALTSTAARVGRTSSAAGADAGHVLGRVGDYELLAVLGEGGMGTVFRARQGRPRREVALKLIRAGFFSERLRRRFEHEAEVLGRLQHESIARVYEAGIDPATQQPYFVMELIDGQRLDDWADRANPDQEARLRMVVAICDAVHHAHTKGVIHRDLKPANILVTSDDKPKILDFGVARLTDSESALLTRETQTGQVLGTLAYMSPEQAAGHVEEVDTRSDVYALGAIAYELLSGRLPLAVAGKPLPAAARMIAEEEPSRLSGLDRTLKGDVETIVGKALAKEKEHRYDSAASLAGDIRRYLDYEPITARPPSTWYNLRKFARRNKAVVGGVAASFLILLAGAGVSTVFAFRAQRQATLAEQRRELAEKETLRATAAESDAVRQKEAAQRQQALAEETKQFFVEMFWWADPAVALGKEMTAVELVERAVGRLEGRFDDEPLVKSELQNTLAYVLDSIGESAQAEALLRAAVEQQERVLGPDHPETLATTNNLGSVLMSIQKHEEAESVLRKLLSAQAKARGPSDLDTLRAAGNLGMVLKSLDRPVEAEPLLRRALAGFEQALGAEHSDVLMLREQRALAIRDLGRLEEAEDLLREVLEGRRRALGEVAPDTLQSMRSLAQVMRARGNLAEAAQLLRESLEPAERILGPEHPNTLVTLHDLALTLAKQGKLTEAEPLMRRAAEVHERQAGFDHPRTLTHFSGLAGILLPLGRAQEAEAISRRVLEARRRVLGPHHPETVTSMANVAELLASTGDLDEAAALAEEALDQTAAGLGVEHPRARSLAEKLVRLLERTGHDGAQVAEVRQRFSLEADPLPATRPAVEEPAPR